MFKRLLIIILICLTFKGIYTMAITDRVESKIVNENEFQNIKINKKIFESDLPSSNVYNFLKIDKINLQRRLYDKNDINNDVDKNVELLYPDSLRDIENSNVVLAAHSGSASIAFFDDLDRLELGDNITLIVNKQNYFYEVKKVEEVIKDGNIEIASQNRNLLYLTTCSKNDDGKQLIITAQKV